MRKVQICLGLVVIGVATIAVYGLLWSLFGYEHVKEKSDTLGHGYIEFGGRIWTTNVVHGVWTNAADEQITFHDPKDRFDIGTDHCGIGNWAFAMHPNSIAIGASVRTTEPNQLRIKFVDGSTITFHLRTNIDFGW